jgi:hypothetical protein
MAIDLEKLNRVQQERGTKLPEHKARAILNNILPRIEAYGWTRLRRMRNGDEIHGSGAMFVNDQRKRSFIASVGVEDDGKIWLHGSLATQTGELPTWQEFVEAKEYFAGAESYAVQVIPPRASYVNIHPTALHFFICLDKNPLPDFTSGTGSI